MVRDIIQVTSIINTIAINTGITKLSSTPVKTVIFSAEATIIFPLPIAALVENRRSKPVPTWIAPAGAPPASKPTPQRISG